MVIHSDNEDGNKSKPGNFQVKFRKLQEFKAVHGHIDPNSDDMGPLLSRFVKNQLRKDQAGALTEKRKQKLQALGMDFTVDAVVAVLETNTKKHPSSDANMAVEGNGSIKKNMWKKKYQALAQFHQENGTCDVPDNHPLAKWVKLQKKRSSKLRTHHPKKFELLNALGLDWGKPTATMASSKKARHQAIFKKKLAQLLAFKNENGHCNVPEDHPELGRWVKSLRARYNAGGLKKNHPEKVEKLSELGFEWNGAAAAPGEAKASTSMIDLRRRFHKKFVSLRAFRDEHGHCNVPNDHPELGRLAKSLRARYASGGLKKNHPEKVEALTKLGFEWNEAEFAAKAKSSPRLNFQQKIALLRAFKDTHGNCNVPKDHPELGKWVQSVRSRYSSGELKKNPDAKRKYNLIKKHFPELLEDLDGVVTCPMPSNSSTSNNLRKHKKMMSQMKPKAKTLG